MRRIDPRLLTMMLLGYGDSQRRLLEVPILADVWSAFASDPAGAHPLLLTVAYGTDAGTLADAVDRFPDVKDIAAIQGFVAARFRLHHLVGVLLPLTHWWAGFGSGDEMEAGGSGQPAYATLLRALERMRAFEGSAPTAPAPRDDAETHLPYRVRQLTGLALVLGTLEALAAAKEGDDREPIASIGELESEIGFDQIADRGAGAIAGLHHQPVPAEPMVWIVTTNRRVDYATTESIRTVKGDAARTLFAIDCSKLTWAVLDSGIDGAHPAFAGPDGASRVTATYDFGAITRILDRRNARDDAFRAETARQLSDHAASQERRDDLIWQAANSYLANPATADWKAIEALVRRDRPERPRNPHGTHVAGILGGYWEKPRPGGKAKVMVDGICRDINLVDIRVLGDNREQTEFAVICALQFVRYLNTRTASRAIDGVNLSLSIPHDVLSYACGKTPVCLEADKLVAEGTVVVAAAGNNGYQSFRLAAGGVYDGYAVASISDPGNTESVITVGSTHRFAPHTYGVSYFSSRGPTGDGRAKPDLLAPGERITSAVPGAATDTMDGTSMAAPHVSGAAALLMARHRELRGEPATIKAILCENTTDVGRIADFQGHGLLDILRALQSNWRRSL